jgi:hypothetical protein
MLNCKIAKGVESQCETSIGGILKLAFANYQDTDPISSYTQSTGSCEIDTISLNNSGHAYEVDFLDGTGLAEVELNVGDSTDQKNFTHRITMNLAKLDCNLLEQYKNWSLAHVIAFVQQKDGNVYVYGADTGLAATTFNYSSGSKEGDAIGVNAVFEGIQLDAPKKVKDWDVVKALFPTT